MTEENLVQSDTKETRIGSVAELQDGGKGLRFDVKNSQGDVIPAFAILFEGQYFAYLNRCGHIAVQLDYMPGDFFSDDGRTLVCATHGAEYAPETGACLGGPCYGVGLEKLDVNLRNDELYLDSEYFSVEQSQ